MAAFVPLGIDVPMSANVLGEKVWGEKSEQAVSNAVGRENFAVARINSDTCGMDKKAAGALNPGARSDVAIVVDVPHCDETQRPRAPGRRQIHIERQILPGISSS